MQRSDWEAVEPQAARPEPNGNVRLMAKSPESALRTKSNETILTSPEEEVASKEGAASEEEAASKEGPASHEKPASEEPASKEPAPDEKGPSSSSKREGGFSDVELTKLGQLMKKRR